MSVEQKEPKMGPVAVVMYGAILCVHYPLKLTLATLEKSKQVVTTTASLPVRALDNGINLIRSLKQSVQESLRAVLGVTSTFLPHNLIPLAIQQARELVKYLRSFVKSAKVNSNENENHRTEADRDLDTNKDSLGVNILPNLKNKCEAIALWVVNQISTTISSIKNAISATSSGSKHLIQKHINNALNLTQNGFNYVLSFVKILKQSSQNQLHQNNINGEAEQTLAAQIIKLQEELKRSQRNNVDNERIKCDKQIHDLQDQLTQMHLTYTQQTQNLQAEIDKERLQYEKEIAQLKLELKQASFNYEQCCEQLTKKFDGERLQYHDELQKLLDRTSQLRFELEKYEVRQDDSIENAYVKETLKSIENVKMVTDQFKEKVAEFIGSKTDKEFVHLNEQIIKNIINIDAIESKGFNVLKKKRLEVLNVIQKLQEELKNKS